MQTFQWGFSRKGTVRGPVNDQVFFLSTKIHPKHACRLPASHASSLRHICKKPSPLGFFGVFLLYILC